MSVPGARKKPVKNSFYDAYKARRLPIYFDSIEDLEIVKSAAKIDKLPVSRYIVRLAIKHAAKVLEDAKSGL